MVDTYDANQRFEQVRERYGPQRRFHAVLDHRTDGTSAGVGAEWAVFQSAIEYVGFSLHQFQA